MNWSKVRHKSKSLRIGKQNIFYVEVHKCYFVTNTGDLLPAKRRSQEHCIMCSNSRIIVSCGSSKGVSKIRNPISCKVRFIGNLQTVVCVAL